MLMAGSLAVPLNVSFALTLGVYSVQLLELHHQTGQVSEPAFVYVLHPNNLRNWIETLIHALDYPNHP